jgi:hypothetical protein
MWMAVYRYNAKAQPVVEVIIEEKKRKRKSKQKQKLKV